MMSTMRKVVVVICCGVLLFGIIALVWSRFSRTATNEPEESRQQTTQSSKIGVAYSSTLSKTKNLQTDHSRSSDSRDERNALYAIAVDYYMGRDNIHFDDKKALSSIQQKNGNVFRSASANLRTFSDLINLSPETNFLADRPAEIMRRRSMVYLLAGYLEHDLGESNREAAKKAYEEIILEPIPSSAAEYIKRVLVSEKIEIMMLLAKFDPDRGLYVFDRIESHRLKQLLLPALQSGLAASMSADELAKALAQRY